MKILKLKPYKKMASHLVMLVLFIMLSLYSHAVGATEPYVYDSQDDLTQLDSFDDAASSDLQDATKEKILMDMLASLIANLEEQLISIKQCASLAKAQTCADQNSLCETALGLVGSAGKTINVVQSYSNQGSGRQNRSVASDNEVRFSKEDLIKYHELKGKSRRLSFEVNQFCLSYK